MWVRVSPQGGQAWHEKCALRFLCLSSGSGRARQHEGWRRQSLTAGREAVDDLAVVPRPALQDRTRKFQMVGRVRKMLRLDAESGASDVGRVALAHVTWPLAG